MHVRRLHFALAIFLLSALPLSAQVQVSGGNPLVIQSTGGVTQLIPASMVKERKRLGRSLMMGADQLGLTAQQVADIAEFLK